jgi:hypothetical protein
VWDILLEYDYKLYRSVVFRIDCDEKQLIIEFTQPFRQKFGQSLTIPLEQLTEQALLSTLANFVRA